MSSFARTWQTGLDPGAMKPAMCPSAKTSWSISNPSCLISYISHLSTRLAPGTVTISGCSAARSSAVVTRIQISPGSRLRSCSPISSKRTADHSSGRTSANPNRSPSMPPAGSYTGSLSRLNSINPALIHPQISPTNQNPQLTLPDRDDQHKTLPDDPVLALQQLREPRWRTRSHKDLHRFPRDQSPALNRSQLRRSRF